MKTLLLLVASLAAPFALAETSLPRTPYGVYRITSGSSGAAYHLIVTEDASILSAPGAFLVQVPAQCGSLRYADPVPTPIPFLKPRWNQAAARLSASGNTGRYMNSVLAQFLDQDRIAGEFTTTNASFAPARRNGRQVPIPFNGERVPEERALGEVASQSLIQSDDRGQAEGEYSGRMADGTRVRLVLNRVQGADLEYWDATFYLQNHEGVGMASSPAVDGLIRMVRAPLPDPLTTTGITGAVVRNAGKIEFRGYLFVVRTGCVMPLTLTKES